MTSSNLRHDDSSDTTMQDVNYGGVSDSNVRPGMVASGRCDNCQLIFLLLHA